MHVLRSNLNLLQLKEIEWEREDNPIRDFLLGEKREASPLISGEKDIEVKKQIIHLMKAIRKPRLVRSILI